MSEKTHLLYRARDISCDHCRRAIEEAVGALPGINRVFVDVPAKTVDVNLTGKGADEAQVRATIKVAGYPITEELQVD